MRVGCKAVLVELEWLCACNLRSAPLALYVDLSSDHHALEVHIPCQLCLLTSILR